MPKRKCKNPESEALQAQSTSKQPKKPKKVKPKVEELPDLLAQWPSPAKVIFEPLTMKGRLSPQPNLPPGIGIEPYELFSLFIPEDLYILISKHTNLYANLHNAGKSGRPWKPTTPGETKIFFAAIFYMGA
jgi:hypothetical protein